ncbi:MAG: cytochrome P450 [Acidimicrobiales bacterium]|nr:cytochrome P450 [Acidimicrobiales bacterium]
MTEPSDFDPGDLEAAADPYATLAALRAEAPVRLLRSGFVAVTGHQEALDALRHPACGTAPIAARYLDGLPEGAARDEMSHRINFLDPPDHPRVRGLVSKAFTPRRVAALGPWMGQAAEALLDGLVGTGPFDLLTRFAHQLPSLVISELLGVPPDDREELTHLSDATAPLLGVRVDDADRTSAIAAAERMHAYLGALLDERSRHPGDDLLSALLAAEEDGERLDRVELLSLAATLYSAGHRTTRDLFTNGMSALLTEPDRWAAVVDGAWAPDAVVSEFLRFETPTLFVARIPYEPIELGGVVVDAFAPLLVYLAAANRDPATYEEPDAFQPDRAGPAPLSFAFGAHYCLGASLAKAEAEIMLRALATRCPDLHLAGDLHWHQRGPFRGLDALPVEA